MLDTKALIERVYVAFNTRDVDGVLVHMSEDVSWPKASEGGKVVGKDEIRAYWARQWHQFDPHVEPLEIVDRGDGRVDVRVRQVVKDLQGELLADDEVRHVYRIDRGLIVSMDLDSDDASAAFAHREPAP